LFKGRAVLDRLITDKGGKKEKKKKRKKGRHLSAFIRKLPSLYHGVIEGKRRGKRRKKKEREIYHIDPAPRQSSLPTEKGKEEKGKETGHVSTVSSVRGESTSPPAISSVYKEYTRRIRKKKEKRKKDERRRLGAALSYHSLLTNREVKKKKKKGYPATTLINLTLTETPFPS